MTHTRLPRYLTKARRELTCLAGGRAGYGRPDSVLPADWMSHLVNLATLELWRGARQNRDFLHLPQLHYYLGTDSYACGLPVVRGVLTTLWILQARRWTSHIVESACTLSAWRRDPQGCWCHNTNLHVLSLKKPNLLAGGPWRLSIVLALAQLHTSATTGQTVGPFYICCPYRASISR
jgi:hypothetical protein